eukprot:SAG11_NODE_25_length_23789_cov_23.813592_11_plen_117_part_00
MPHRRRLRILLQQTTPTAARTTSSPPPPTISAATSAERDAILLLAPLSTTLQRPSLTFGAEDIGGFDLRELAERGHGRQAIYDALLEHGVLIFRKQARKIHTHNPQRRRVRAFAVH